MKKTDKKELQVRPAEKHPPLYEVFYTCGGELPRALTSKFTSRADAQYAIAQHADKKASGDV